MSETIIQELAEKVDQLASRVEELEDDRARLQDDLETEREQRRALEEYVEDVDDRLADGLEGVHNRISASLDQPSQDAGDALDDADDAELPIQQIARMPEEMAKAHLDNMQHRNTYRARFLWRDLTDYATQTPAGFVVSSADAQRVLRAGLDDRIETTTAKRVFDRIVSYTHGIAERRKKNGEWILVVPADWKDQAAELDSDALADASGVVTSGG